MSYKGGVRLFGYAAVGLAAVALAGCGGDDLDAELGWDGPPDPDADGVVAVDGFASYQEQVDGRWERSAATAAAEFLRLDERTATTTTIEGSASAEGTGPETVVVTLDGLLDDSVRAMRWTLDFDQENRVFRLVSARWGQRCQPERGHQDFSPQPCV